MKDKDFLKVPIFENHMGNAFIPVNDSAHELISLSRHGERVALRDETARDLSFHMAYFGLINYIYNLLPYKFKSKCPQGKFYLFIKEIQGAFTETHIGSKSLKEYNSISFGNMSQKRFEAYVAEQLPIIYTEIIEPLMPDRYEEIVNLIEEEWQNFLSKIL